MISQIWPYLIFLVLSPVLSYKSLTHQLVQTSTNFLHFTASLLLHLLLLLPGWDAYPPVLPIKMYHPFFNSNLYATPLVKSFPPWSPTLPAAGGHFLLHPQSIFFVFLWWNLSHSALYWSPVSLSPSLRIQAGTLFYLILPVPIKLNASLHLASPHTWLVSFLNLPFPLDIFYSIISKWSENMPIGNECKEEWLSACVCTLVREVGSESASVACLCCAVARASESVCRAGCEKHTLQQKLQTSKVYPPNLLQGVPQHSFLSVGKGWLLMQGKFVTRERKGRERDFDGERCTLAEQSVCGDKV